MTSHDPTRRDTTRKGKTRRDPTRHGARWRRERASSCAAARNATIENLTQAPSCDGILFTHPSPLPPRKLRALTVPALSAHSEGGKEGAFVSGGNEQRALSPQTFFQHASYDRIQTRIVVGDKLFTPSLARAACGEARAPPFLLSAPCAPPPFPWRVKTAWYGENFML